MIYVKLTSADAKTTGCGYGRTLQWVPGVRHEAQEVGPLVLCKPTCLHSYGGETLEEALACAVFMDSIYNCFGTASRAFVVEPEGEVLSDGGTKCGARVMVCGVEVTEQLPNLDTNVRVRVGIEAALLVYQGPEFRVWAEGWKNGRDRSTKAAVAAVAIIWAAWDAAGAVADAAGAVGGAAGAAAEAAGAVAWVAARAAGVAGAAKIHIGALVLNAIREEGELDLCAGAEGLMQAGSGAVS